MAPREHGYECTLGAPSNPPPCERFGQGSYFESKTAGLPEAMIDQLAVWFEIMRHGSRAPPRRKPLDDHTTRVLSIGHSPLLRAGADAGI